MHSQTAGHHPCEPQLLPRIPEAGATAAAAAAESPVSKCRSQPTPSREPVLPTTAKGPMIWGQLPWENARHTSGCSNFLLASATAGTPHTPQL